jgi:hypothetical protein
MITRLKKLSKLALAKVTVPRIFKSALPESQQENQPPNLYPELQLPDQSASEEDLTWEGASPPPLESSKPTKIRSYSIPRLIIAVSLIIMGLIAGFELGMMGYQPEATTKYKSLFDEHD